MNIVLSPGRYLSLIETIAGYGKTGTPLVSWNGTELKSVSLGDDIGLFYFAPKFAAFTHGNAHEAMNLFCGLVIGFALVCGLIGCLLLYKKTSQRVVGLIGLLWLARIGLTTGDVYLFSLALAIGIIPLFLWFARQNRAGPAFGAFLFAAGLAVGAGNWIRLQSGSALLLFLGIVLLAGLTAPLKSRVLLLLCLLAGLTVTGIACKSVEHRAEVYLIANQPGYQPLLHQHVIWHSIYIGFGFVANEYGLAYDDDIGVKKVASIDPSVPFCSVEYERILRGVVFQFVRAHPGFIMEELSAKAGILLYYFIRYINIGLLFAWRCRRPRAIDAAFWAAMTLGALPGLLVVPFIMYVTSFIAFAALYAVYCINDALEKGQFTLLKPKAAIQERGF